MTTPTKVPVSVKAVFFDGRGTLFDLRQPRHEIYAHVASEFGDPVDVVLMKKVMETADKTFPLVWQGGYRFSPEWFRRYVERVLDEVGFWGELEPCVAKIFATFADPKTFVAFPDAIEAVATLRKRGLRLGVLSNWGVDLPQILRGIGFGDAFTVTLDSASEQMEKPAPEFFRRGLERIGVAAKDAMHVGDHPEKDARAAQSQGMTGVFLDRTGTVPFDGLRIRRLTELPALIA
ncbi:MAG: HAD-IA family hydrolase [Planctomycetes bacterium]|nr:HAD-IA family hydrolase [Planctomycetota bacterium]